MRFPVIFRGLAACAFLLLCGTSPADDESDSLGIKAPEGFEVSLFAGDELAHDIYSMTIDSRGRIVVAGAGYVKILHDDNKDGKADRATLFSSKPASGAHGMVFVGDDLICTGDNSLMKLRDKDGDGVADGEPEIWATLKHSEHGANGVVQGPDGWIYVACGNDAGVTAAHATLPTSPVKKPEAGAILRFSPDGKHSEIFAHGFRNIYDLDFNAFGQLFTVDSDGERDHHLPWYAPTRLFDVAVGMHHGWVLQGHQRSWNRPAYFPDVAPRLCEIGRGSPTGVVVYRHTQFPKEYHNAVFSACWTLGKVYSFGGHEKDPIYSTKVNTFLETTGETGFAPVDLAIGPAGEMFVAVGGRGTRGSVFRVAYTGEQPPKKRPKRSLDGNTTVTVREVLNAPQPLAAWSRAKWIPAARKAGRNEFLLATLDWDLDELQRARALEVITELFGGLAVAEAEDFAEWPGTTSWSAQARAIWSVERTRRGCEVARLLAALARAEPLLNKSFHDSSASFKLALWQAIANLSGSDEESDAEFRFADPQLAIAKERSRRVRNSMLRADARLQTPLNFGQSPQSAVDLWRLHVRGALKPEHFGVAVRAFVDGANDEERLDAIRLMQIVLGDINVQPRPDDLYAGYSANATVEEMRQVRDEFGAELASQFPAFDSNQNFELARLLGMLEVNDSKLLDRISTFFGADVIKSSDAIHYLTVTSRFSGKRSVGVTRRTAEGLFKIFNQQERNSRNWPLRVGEMVDVLYARDPNLASMIASDSRLQSSHSLLIAHMNPELRVQATRAVIKAGGARFQWTDELVRLVGALPESEALNNLRFAWLDIAVHDSVILVAARSPHSKDTLMFMFLEGLASTQPDVAEAAARAMLTIPDKLGEEELAAAISALRQHCLAIENKSTRKAIVELLHAWTKQEFQIEEPKEQKKLLAAYKPWFDWLEQEHPAIAKKVAGFGDASAEEWLVRLKKVDWASGDEQRGLAVFQKKACHKCHAGNSPLGPSLAGAAARFSREDLFGSILDPHKEVAPPYQTTQIATSSGKVYSGLVVYESPDATLVQTTPDTTIRIAGDEILSMKKGRVSLMPSGLLNDVSNIDLADLYAHLKTIKNQK